jgi:hypothetical protein
MTEHEGAMWVQARLLGSGWAAVMHVAIEVTDAAGESLGGYVDVMDTHAGRFASEAEAQRVGRAWAESEGLPFVG